MSPALFVLLSLAGGAGAAARLALDGAVRARFGARLPWGTIAVNLSGSLLLGGLTGLVADGLDPAVLAVAGSGFLGGYTTFSTASFETVRLLQAGRPAAAVASGVVQPALAIALALGGYLFGRAL